MSLSHPLFLLSPPPQSPKGISRGRSSPSSSSSSSSAAAAVTSHSLTVSKKQQPSPEFKSWSSAAAAVTSHSLTISKKQQPSPEFKSWSSSSAAAAVTSHSLTVSKKQQPSPEFKSWSSAAAAVTSQSWTVSKKQQPSPEFKSWSSSSSSAAVRSHSLTVSKKQQPSPEFKSWSSSSAAAAATSLSLTISKKQQPSPEFKSWSSSSSSSSSSAAAAATSHSLTISKKQQPSPEFKSRQPSGDGRGLFQRSASPAVRFGSTPPLALNGAQFVARNDASREVGGCSERRTGGGGGWPGFYIGGGEEVLRGGFLQNGPNNACLLQPREFPGRQRRRRRKAMVGLLFPTTCSSLHSERGHEISGCCWGGRGGEKTQRISGAWMAANPLHGRARMCVVLVRAAEAGGEASKSPHEHPHLKPEIHGRRTRAGRPKSHSPYDNIMLQGFNWESHKGSKDGKTWWQVLKSQVEELQTLGVTDIWLPPVSQSVDRQGYLPSELYNLDASKYGTGVHLKELIDELHNHGICVIADIVINHRSGGLQDNSGHWNVFKGGNRDKRLDWGPWAVVDDDVYDSGGKGHHDTGESYAAAPDLDHTNKRVQDELTDWMNWLKAEIGFDGWRFDFVKGYAAAYTKLYCMRTNPTIAVGELWTSMAYYDGQLSWDQNKHRQELCNWIDGTGGASCAFDFTTKGILQRAIENEFWRLKDANGKAPGLIGWWPEKSVTFLDNHDTGSTQRHWAFPDKKVLGGYAYILTHPGIPCIFYDHIYGFKLMDEIKKLLDLRKRHRINAVSRLNIQKAEGDIYVAKIDDRVILKLGPRFDMGSLLPGKDTWKMTLTGPDYAIWETTAPLPPLPVPSVPAEDDDQGHSEPSHPTQPIHITSKMSEETRNRILKEVPELVDSIDATKNNSIRGEQDHVHKRRRRR